MFRMYDIKGSRAQGNAVDLTKLHYCHYVLVLFSIFSHLGKHLVCRSLDLLSKISIFLERTNSKRNIFVWEAVRLLLIPVRVHLAVLT